MQIYLRGYNEAHAHQHLLWGDHHLRAASSMQYAGHAHKPDAHLFPALATFKYLV